MVQVDHSYTRRMLNSMQKYIKLIIFKMPHTSGIKDADKCAI